MQRKADNPQYCIIESAAFMEKYRQIRLKRIPTQGQSADAFRYREMEIEIEYNLGRMFHHVRLYQYAIAHYHKALKHGMHVEKGQTQNSIVQEVAYNLSLVYRETGNLGMVEYLYRTFLSL